MMGRQELRAMLLRNPDLRAGAEDVLIAVLVELAGEDDWALAPAWLPTPVCLLSVGEVRQQIRATLAEIASREWKA